MNYEIRSCCQLSSTGSNYQRRKDNETDVSSFSPLSERSDVRLETTVTQKYHGKSLMSILHNWKNYVGLYFLLLLNTFLPNSFPATIVSSQTPYFLLSCIFVMFNWGFTLEASATILRDDRERVTSNGVPVDWHHPLKWRVVTTRQYFQPASPPQVSSYTRFTWHFQ